MRDSHKGVERYYELVAYVKTKGSGEYVSMAYPQIAKALELLAKNIPNEYNIQVGRGYAIVLDIMWKVLAYCIVTCAIAAVFTYIIRSGYVGGPIAGFLSIVAEFR